MSVRIYQLSKEIGMENHELIELLKERGYEVRSASSTVDNISADSLRQEFAPKAEAAAEEAPAAQTAHPEAAPEPRKPSGVAIVRTKEDVERERRERVEAQRRNALVQPPPAANKPAPVVNRKAAPAVVAPPPVAPRAPLRSNPRGPRASAPRPMGVPSGGIVKPPPSARPAPPSPRQPEPEAKPETSGPEAKQAAPAPVVPSPSPVAPPLAPPRANPAPPPAAPPRVSAPAPAAPAPMAPPAASRPSPASPPTATPVTSLSNEAATAEAPTEAEPAKPKVVTIKPPIVVRDFANTLGLKPFQLISELMEMSIFASMNLSLEEDVAKRIAARHGFELDIRHRGETQPTTPKAGKKKKAKVDTDEKLEERPPVVCILGHVDHGKTTLLDTIRQANVVDGEAGGITQHVGAYQVERNDKKITFIDTPGHAAFSNMRARGANTTDIAILVVAADDGFMPQTDEALGHAQNAGVPVVVAINKIDTRGANPAKVRAQMQQRGIAPEDLGGETLLAEVSALKGDGIDQLLEAVLLQAEIMELSAPYNGPVEGIVVEAQKEQGRGPTANAIIQRGTLKVGDSLVCGPVSCKVRAMLDDKGKNIKQATPSTPVKIIGWSDTPDAGQLFQKVKNDREAKAMALENELQRKRIAHAKPEEDEPPATIESLFAAIEQTQSKVFKVLVKSDVYGTAEALAGSLEQIVSDKIEIEVIDVGVGAISKNDVSLASAAGASIVAFNIGMETGVAPFAKHEGTRIFKHNIIYELINNVRDAMAEELDPELRENKIGAASVRAVFPLAKGQVAGCLVTEGNIRRDAGARLLRGEQVIAEGKVDTLKRFKDDATEVRAGYECGIRLAGWNDYQEGDTIECYEILKIRASL